MKRLGNILILGCVILAWGTAVPASAQPITTEALLDTLQHSAFDYFWNEANPSNGLIKDRNTAGSPSSIAAVGFGLTAINIAIDRGWVTRSAGAARVLTTLETFWNGPQGSLASGMIGYQGFFYHFLDMNTATRTWDSELSTIDTALLMAGVLDAGQYFTGADTVETRIRELADSLYLRANWNFMRNFNPGIMMGWKPGVGGFAGFGQWIGYNEAMILYILALGSPTYPVPSNSWSVWTSGYSWQTHYGYSYVNFPPLFGHQYSHCWIDFRNNQDAYLANYEITYFENSRRAALAAREYCIANPLGHTGYSGNLWGITASDGPFGYSARGAPPAQNDDGTIAPTAAFASIPFAPEVVIPTMHYLWDNYKPVLWGAYGFRDALNLNQIWWATDVIGIDQGPIIVMIENYRTGSVWNRFMQSPYVQTGLQRAGFATPVGIPEDRQAPVRRLQQNFPNPVQRSSWIPFSLDVPGHVTLSIHDVSGRLIRTLVDEVRTPGEYREPLGDLGLPGGVYFYRLDYGGRTESRRMVVLP